MWTSTARLSYVSSRAACEQDNVVFSTDDARKICRAKLAALDHSSMTSMNAAELATWTPVALNLEASTPYIDWGDFGGLRFTEPFFDETVALWAAGNPPPRMVRTDLNALVVLDQAPSLDPSGLIFHLSRCGSTLLARLLRQIPGCVVVSEPQPVNSLLVADSAVVDEETQVQLLRLLIRALGRRRFGDERHYVVKLSSWNVRKLDLFRRAFPAAPVVWVQRNPAEVMMSLLARRPGWLQFQAEPELAGSLFDIAPDEVSTLEPTIFYVRALAALLKAARGVRAGIMPTIEYADLPEASWTTVAPLFGLSHGAEDVARMAAEARYYSKESTPRVFNRQTPDRDSIPEPIRLLAAEHLDALYRELSGRQASKPAPPRSGASQ
jgi:hypothetical protein